jgi:uncharacterized membrane protein
MGRRGYLDWLRGVAVLVMIEAHVIDSWTHAADRHTWQYGWSMILGGFGAPLFLFLAGVAVAFSAASKFRKTGDRHAAGAAVARRGLEIFLLAFVFRIQAWILGWASPYGLLKVDILNIMGPSIAAAAAIWALCRSSRERYVWLAAVTAAIALATPFIRATPALAGLPDPVEAYLRPRPNLTNFTFFPWAAFVSGGAVVGMLIEASRTMASERRVNRALFAGGLALALGAYAASFRPSIYPHSDFWTSSPAFFAIRLGVMTAFVGVAFAWAQRPTASRWSPLQQLGRTSLFIYWIHVEMVYGVISMPLHQGLSLRAAWLALFVFWIFMLGCSVAKDRVVATWKRRAPAEPATV